MTEFVVYPLIIGMAFVWGVGGVLFGVAFRDLGAFELTLPYLLRWLLNPVIIAAVLTGILARLLFYVGITYLSVSQLTLFGTLGIVATLFLGRVILGDELSLKEWVGAVLVIVGSAFIGD